MIGIHHTDTYAVTETMQLLKVPWEWYVPGNPYDVVIARKGDIPAYTGNLIDIANDDIFENIAQLLNTGRQHLRTPLADRYIAGLRKELKKYTILIEIPPSPWGYPYMVALTHDVDTISVRKSSLRTVLVGAVRCFLKGKIFPGMRILAAKAGIAEDPWDLFGTWQRIEKELGVRSTFYVIPEFSHKHHFPHRYRDIHYKADKKQLDLARSGGWEIGVHGIDGWAIPQLGSDERKQFDGCAGNRTHWLLQDGSSWSHLDAAGYGYDSSFGYDDDVGFRAGTTQVYQPVLSSYMLELPLHIQDAALYGKSCWGLAGSEWIKTPCLNLNDEGVRNLCREVLECGKLYGGVITLLWHYENIVPPRDWKETWVYLVRYALGDGAYVSTAENIVNWFRRRRGMHVAMDRTGNAICISVSGIPDDKGVLPYRIRLHVKPESVRSANTDMVKTEEYVDLLGKPEIVVVLE